MYRAEPRNLIAVVDNYFFSNSNLIKQNCSDFVNGEDDKAKLVDLKKETVFRLLSKPDPEPDENIVADIVNEIISCSNGEIRIDSAKNNRLKRLSNNLPEDISKIYENFFEGLDLTSIALQLNKSLDQVFTVMRLVERRLQGFNSKKAVAKGLTRGWSNLGPRQQECLELSLLGFEDSEIERILDMGKGNLVNRRSIALQNLAKTSDDYQEARYRIESSNIYDLKTFRAYRLIDYVFGFDEIKNTKEHPALGQGYSNSAEILEELLMSLPEKTQSMLDLYFIGFNYQSIARALNLADSSAPRISKSIRETRESLAKRFEEYLKEEVPHQKIDKAKWSALDKLDRKVFIASLDNKSPSEIFKLYGELENLPSSRLANGEFIKKQQVFHMIKGIMRDLEISKEEFEEISKERTNLVKTSLTDEDLAENCFQRLFPEGLASPVGLTMSHKAVIFNEALGLVDRYKGLAKPGYFDLYIRGYTIKEISQSYNLETRVCKDQMNSLLKYLRRELKKQIDSGLLKTYI